MNVGKHTLMPENALHVYFYVKSMGQCYVSKKKQKKQILCVKRTPELIVFYSTSLNIATNKMTKKSTFLKADCIKVDLC